MISAANQWVEEGEHADTSAHLSDPSHCVTTSLLLWCGLYPSAGLEDPKDPEPWSP